MKRRARRGYSLIEVMVAISILAIGVTGIVSMQQASHVANRQAQSLTVATNISRLWLERLRTDALQWNAPSSNRTQSDLGTTTYLCALVGCTGSGSMATPGQWFVPAGPAGSTESAGFDYAGNEVTLDSGRVFFCTNMRLTWLRPDTGSRQGLIRAEVRVWWYRDNVGRKPAYDRCGGTAALQTLDGDLETLSFVYTASVLSGSPL